MERAGDQGEPPGASDADLARVINETAGAQGYDYTITPDKVRTKGKKRSAPQLQPAPTPFPKATPACFLDAGSPFAPAGRCLAE